MRTLQRLLVCALLIALILLVVYTAVLVRTTTATIAQIPPEFRASRAAVIAELQATRTDLLTRSERQLTAIRKDVIAQAAEMRETADRRIGDTLSRADSALDTVNALRQDLKPTLDHSSAITAQVQDSLPLFLDCDHNPDCVFNRYVGASKGIERAALNFGQMSQDTRAALPKMLVTWNQIGVSASTTAANLDRLTKPHWYDRLLGYTLNGVLIYRNLNPTTNLTVKGAQILSARP